MASSIFLRRLADLERLAKKDLSENSVSNVVSSALLKRLISFVEEGSFTNSEAEKFICKNFRLNSEELSSKWVLLNPRKEKSANTFRVQQRVLSLSLETLFSLSADELYLAFTYKNESGLLVGVSSYLKQLDECLVALSFGDFDLSSRFDLSLLNYCVADYPAFEIDDCEKELKLLKTFFTFQDLCSSIDKQKLSFIIGILAQPLLEKERDKKTKEVSYYMNQGKFELANKLFTTDALKVSSKKLDIIKVEKSSQDSDTTKSENSWTSSYNLELTEVLENVIKNRLSIPYTKEELSSSNAESVQKLGNIISAMYTEEGLLRWLSSINLVDFGVALKSFEKD